MVKKLISAAVFDGIRKFKQGKYSLLVSFIQRKEENTNEVDQNFIFQQLSQIIYDDVIINEKSKWMRLLYLAQDKVLKAHNYLISELVVYGTIIVIDKQYKKSVDFGVSMAKCPSEIFLEAL